MLKQTITRILFNGVKEIQNLPDGTIVQTDCYSGIGWFEKTPDGLEQGCIGLSWEKINCNDFYIEVKTQTEFLGIEGLYFNYNNDIIIK